MTDCSDITQYQQDTITQTLLSQMQYEFLLASAQKISHTDRKRQTHTHAHTDSDAVALSAKWTTGVDVAKAAGLHAASQKVM